MRRLRSLILSFTPAALVVPFLLTFLAVALSARPAKADVTIFDQDGWSFHTSGLVAAHYQLVTGDADSNRTLAGGRINDEGTITDVRDPTHPTTTLSNVRSGFIGTQIGFGVDRQISSSVHVESKLAISMEGINSNRGQNLQKDVDYREGWAAVVTPYGTLKFGRMFGVFGEGSAEVMMMAYQYGVGHPCIVSSATIACGSSGAGPLYAGFDSAIRYISPRIAGFQFTLSVADPVVGGAVKMSPYPRVDTEVNFDNTFGPLHLRLIGQTMFNRISATTMGVNNAGAITLGTIKTDNVWGAMGTGIARIAGLTVGGGAWTGSGVGERVPFEQSDPSQPLSLDNSLQLRKFRGFYGNVQYELANNSLTVGGGELFVQPTATDDLAANNLVLIDQFEYHVTYHYKWDAIVFNLEYMHWHTDWHDDPMMPNVAALKQDLNFMGGGVNYLW
jgi:predicted porin